MSPEKDMLGKVEFKKIAFSLQSDKELFVVYFVDYNSMLHFFNQEGISNQISKQFCFQ